MCSLGPPSFAEPPSLYSSELLQGTVLLGNVMVNSYFAILMTEFWSGTAEAQQRNGLFGKFGALPEGFWCDVESWGGWTGPVCPGMEFKLFGIVTCLH